MWNWWTAAAVLAIVGVLALSGCKGGKKQAVNSPPARTETPKVVKAGEAVYACPMHPEVTSTNKGDRCPKCGMLLELSTGSGATTQPDGSDI